MDHLELLTENNIDIECLFLFTDVHAAVIQFPLILLGSSNRVKTGAGKFHIFWVI